MSFPHVPRLPILQLLEHGIHDLIRLALPAEIRRERLALLEDDVDGGVDARGGLGVAEVREEQRGRPDRRDRVGDALALDVGGRAVDAGRRERVSEEGWSTKAAIGRTARPSQTSRRR